MATNQAVRDALLLVSAQADVVAELEEKLRNEKEKLRELERSYQKAKYDSSNWK